MKYKYYQGGYKSRSVSPCLVVKTSLGHITQVLLLFKTKYLVWLILLSSRHLVVLLMWYRLVSKQAWTWTNLLLLFYKREWTVQVATGKYYQNLGYFMRYLSSAIDLMEEVHKSAYRIPAGRVSRAREDSSNLGQIGQWTAAPFKF